MEDEARFGADHVPGDSGQESDAERLSSKQEDGTADAPDGQTRLESAWGKSASGRSGWGARIALIALVAAVVGAAVVLIGRRPNPARGMMDLVEALNDDDAQAFALMSERYRQTHELDDFRRAIATMSELRDVQAVSSAPSIGFSRPDEVEFCSRTTPAFGRLRIRVVWEGQWRVDALTLGSTHLDDDHRVQIQCGVTR